MAEAIGAAFLGIIRYVKDQRGSDYLESVIQQSNDELKKIFARKIITIGWYPYKSYGDFLTLVDRLLGRGDGESCREVGKFAAKRDMDSIYSIYKERAKPIQLVRDGGIIWKSYYRNAGRFETISDKPENTILRIVEFSEMVPAHCRLMEGWMTEVMRLAGAKIIREVREQMCMSRGAPYHEFICAWAG